MLKDDLLPGYVLQSGAEGVPSVVSLEISRCGTGDDIKFKFTLKAVAIVLQPAGVAGQGNDENKVDIEIGEICLEVPLASIASLIGFKLDAAVFDDLNRFRQNKRTSWQEFINEATEIYSKVSKQHTGPLSVSGGIRFSIKNVVVKLYEKLTTAMVSLDLFSVSSDNPMDL